MASMGYCPSGRLFEAAACGTPIVSDPWPGLDAVFAPGHEIVVADRTEDVVALLAQCSEPRRLQVAAAARRRVLAEHTAAHRVDQLERELWALGRDRDAA